METPLNFMNSCKASPPTGPYNHCVRAGNFVFVSGLTGLDKETGHLACGGVGEEFRESLRNLACILIDAGSNFHQIVKINILLKNIKDLCKINKVYKEYYTKNFPARTVYQAVLPMKVNVITDCVALLNCENPTSPHPHFEQNDEDVPEETFTFKSSRTNNDNITLTPPSVAIQCVGCGSKQQTAEIDCTLCGSSNLQRANPNTLTEYAARNKNQPDKECTYCSLKRRSRSKIFKGSKCCK